MKEMMFRFLKYTGVSFFMTMGSNTGVLFMVIWLLGNCNRIRLATSPKAYNFGSFWLKEDGSISPKQVNEWITLSEIKLMVVCSP